MCGGGESSVYPHAFSCRLSRGKCLLFNSAFIIWNSRGTNYPPVGITCHFYSSVCLPEFFLGVIDLGNSVLPNIVLGKSAAIEAGITGKPFLVEALLLTAADRGTRMKTMASSLFLDLEFVRGLHSTLLPRPGAGHPWEMSERQLVSSHGLQDRPCWALALA